MAKKKVDVEIEAVESAESEAVSVPTSAEVIADRVAQMEEVLSKGESTYLNDRKHIHFPEGAVELLRQCVQDIKATTKPEVETE